MKSGSDTTTIAEYEYFGDTRRSKKTVSNRGAENVPNDGGNTEVRFYYCGLGGTGVSRTRCLGLAGPMTVYNVHPVAGRLYAAGTGSVIVAD